MSLFCTYLGPSPSRLIFFEDLVAGLVTRFLLVEGSLFARAGYLGSVDLGVAVTNLKEAVSSKTLQNAWGYEYPQYNRPEYRRKTRVLSTSLVEAPQEAAKTLVMPLVAAISQERYDPFPTKVEIPS